MADARPLRSLAQVLLCGALIVGPAVHAAAPTATKLAVFQFELDDSSAAASPAEERQSDASVLRAVTRDAEEALRKSGRYVVVDAADAELPAKARPLHECDGCEAAIALQQGADQSLVGVVIRVEQTAYAVELQMRDARTGKVLVARRGVFLGGVTEWSSGVTSLLRRMLEDQAKDGASGST